MLHWEEGKDYVGRNVWLRFVECSHWGLFLTAIRPQYTYVKTLRTILPSNVVGP
jgi:hypothetical protein